MLGWRHVPVAVDLGSSRLRVWSPRCRRAYDTPAVGMRNGRVVDDAACASALRRQLDVLGRGQVDVTVAVPALADAADAVGRVLAAAGARYVTEVEQLLAAAIGAGVDVASSRPALVLDLGAGLVEVAVVGDGAVRAQRVLEWGIGDLAAAAQLDAVLGPATELVRGAVDDVLAELPARVAADVAATRPVVVGGGAAAALLRDRLSSVLGVPVATTRSPATAVIDGLAAVMPYAGMCRRRAVR